MLEATKVICPVAGSDGHPVVPTGADQNSRAAPSADAWLSGRPRAPLGSRLPGAAGFAPNGAALLMRWWIWPEFRGAGGLGHRADPGRRAMRQEGCGAVEALALVFSWNRLVGSPWRQNSPIWLRSSCERRREAWRPRQPLSRVNPLNDIRGGRVRAASSPQSWRRPVLDRDPAADTAVGPIECSGTRISRQSSDRAKGHAVSGADRMQCAIRIDLPAAAPDDNLPVDNQRD
jgi:hypothetical protein